MDYSTLAAKLNTGSFSFDDMKDLATSSTNLHALRILAGMEPLPEEIIEILLNRNERKILIALLQNSGIKNDVLVQYSKVYSDDIVLSAIARNVNLDVKLATKIASSFNEKIYKALLKNEKVPTPVLTLMWENCLEQDELNDFNLNSFAGAFRENVNASSVVQMEAHKHPKLKYAPTPKVSLVVNYLKDFYPGISEELPKEWLMELLNPIIEKRFNTDSDKVAQ